MKFFAGGSEKVRLESTGDIGIGTSNPNFASGSGLEIQRDGIATLRLEDTGSGSKALEISMDDATGCHINSRNSGMHMIFSVHNNERLRINTLGNVGIATSSPSEKLHVVGNILASGTITPNSDIAFKKDVVYMSDVLDKVTQLKGINFTYKADNEKSMGLLAQDVEKVFPELVKGQEGNKSLNYMGLMGALVESIKELSTEVQKLKAA